MNCRDVERRLSAYLDGELDESAASALRGHLRLCEACRHIAEAHAAVVEAVATLPTVEPPSTMWDGVLARLGEAEVADAQRPSYWLWWRRVRPHLLTGVALAGAAATFSLWMWKRGELPLAPATDVAIARAAAPAAADTELAAQAPGRPADAPAGAIARDVTDALADDSRALDDSYRTAAEELVALAAEERPAWTPDQVRAFDTRLTGLRAAIDAAPVGSEPRERAWQALIGFLQRAATGERLVAWNGGGPMIRGALLALAVVLAPGIAAAQPKPAGPAPGVFEDDRVEVAPARAPISSVSIDNPLGDLRIEGHDGAGLVILSTKRAPDDDVLDRLRVSLIPDADGAMRVVTAIDPEGPPVPRSLVRIDLVIRAPRGARIDGRVRDGRLELVNMDAGGELDTARGPIVVKNVSGPVYARSLAGAQRFAEVFGTLDAQAVTADLLLDTVRGDRLVASVHEGRIQGRRIRARHIELRSTRGDVTLEGEIAANGDVTVASVAGNVDVRVRAGGPLRVRAVGPSVTVTGGRPLGADLWAVGVGTDAAAIELRSRRGTVRFTVVE